MAQGTNVGSINISFTATDNGVQKVVNDIVKMTSSLQTKINNGINKPMQQMATKQKKIASDINSSNDKIEKSFSDASSKIKNETKEVTSNHDKMTKNLKSNNNEIAKSTSLVSKVFNGLTNVIKFMTFTYIGRQIGNVITSIFELGSAIPEVENVFQVSFQNMADEADAWANQLSRAWGVSVFTLKEQSAIMNNIFTGMKIGEQTAFDMSTSLTQLSYDLASLWNIDQSDAFEKLQSGMVGMSRPLREIGIITDVATISQYAYANGIAQVGDELTQQEKVLATYFAIMDQSKNAYADSTYEVNGQTKALGDFSKTIQSPQNQLRLLMNQLSQVGQFWGLAFLPIAQVVLPILNSLVKMLVVAGQYFATFMAKLFGVGNSYQDLIGDWSNGNASMEDLWAGMSEDTEDYGSAVDGASNSVQELKKQLAGIDEINNLTLPEETSDSSGGVSDNGFSEFNYEVPVMDKQPIYDQLDALGLEIAKFFTDMFKPMADSWDVYGKRLTLEFSKTIEGIKILFSLLGDFISDNWYDVFNSSSNVLFSLVTVVLNITNTITDLFSGIWENGGRTFADGVVDLIVSINNMASKMFSSFLNPLIDSFDKSLAPIIVDVVGGALEFVGERLTNLSSIIDGISFSSLGEGFGNVTSAFEVIVNKSESLTKTFENIGSVLEFLKNNTLEVIGLVGGLVTSFLAFNGINNNLYPIVLFVNSLFSSLSSIVNVFSPIISGAISLATSFSTFAPAIASSITANGLLNTSLTLVAKSLLAILTPINVAIMLVSSFAGAFVYLYTTSEEFRNKMNGIFSDIAKEISNSLKGVMSIINSLINTTLIPMVTILTQSFAKLWEDGMGYFFEQAIYFLGILIQSVMNFMNNAVLPLINLLINILAPTFVIVFDLIMAVVTPVLEAIVVNVGKVIEALNWFMSVLNEFVWPIFKYVFDEMSIRISDFYDFIEPIISFVIDIFQGFIDFLTEIWYVVFSTTIDSVIQVVDGMIEPIANVIKNLIDILFSIIDFVSGVFTGDWKLAWESVVSIFSNIFNGIKSVFLGVWNFILGLLSAGGSIFDGIVTGIENVFKGVVNMLIDGINVVISSPIAFINEILNGIRNFDIPIVGKPFAGLWSDNPIPTPSIPRLASGGIAYGETLAITGEYANAKVNPEVIAPLDKLVGIMTEVDEKRSDSNVNGGTQVIDNNIYINGKLLYKVVSQEEVREKRKTGKTVFST